jgi:hypothetical protein
MGKTTTIAALVALMCAAAVGRAQEAGDQAAEAGQTIKVLVKQYKGLEPSDVYRAAINGTQADVRFKDSFAGQTVVAGSLQRLPLRGRTYRIVLAFRTGNDLMCVVPLSNQAMLRKLLGLSTDWPITPAVLSREISLRRDQEITIEGTIVGTAVGEKVVLVDAVLTGNESRPQTRQEVHLIWPGEETVVLSAPGTQTLSFPCTREVGETVTLSVDVKSLTPERLLAELAAIQGRLEMGRGTKVYRQFAPVVVYRYAGGSEPTNVDFNDKVAAIAAPPLPADLRSVMTWREGRRVRMPVSCGFRTEGGVTCLVPATAPTLCYQARGAVPGEPVLVRGTTIGQIGGRNCVLVDYLGFPNQGSGREGDSWLVTVGWPGGPRMLYWYYGSYQLANLRCQYVAGAAESMRILIGEFMEIRVPETRPATEEAASTE